VLQQFPVAYDRFADPAAQKPIPARFGDPACQMIALRTRAEIHTLQE
jgi:hypothetical protein